MFDFRALPQSVTIDRVNWEDRDSGEEKQETTCADGFPPSTQARQLHITCLQQWIDLSA